MKFQRHQCFPQSQLSRLIGGLVLSLGFALLGSGELAAVPIAGASAIRAATQGTPIVETVAARGGRGGGVAVRGGGVAVRGGGVAVRGGGAAVRGGGVAVRGGGVAVRRGGAVAVGRGGAVAVRGGAAVVRPYRPWVRRAYYGTVIGGVALGTIIAVSAIPPAPSDDLCWFWANQAQTRGYWDYCG